MSAPTGPAAGTRRGATSPERAARARAAGRREGRLSGARLAVAVLVVVLLMFPVYWMLRTSVASTAELSSTPVPLWPRSWDLANYVEPWRQYPFARWLTNSVVVAVVSVVLTVAINLAAGWAFAKLRFPGRDLLFLAILSTLMVPVQVIMIPQFQVVIEMGLLDNPMGVVLPRLAEAFGLFMARQFFLSIPDELVDAATMDGAGHVRTFWSIALPLSGPLVAVLVIFTFMWRWNEFVWPLIVLTTADSYTLPVGLQFLVQQFGSDYGPLLAMSFLSILPMLLVFAVFQRFFVEGVARTGIR
ncbi:carbohydrate ABC transporter permease [Aquipuribacter hungaricus]|uniref:Carbohydrate ABC transporter permease n=1 Tax=Aquipuribacter hungaricus TaxID=545624 RepID=A0ABV7WKK4_9MICO